MTGLQVHLNERNSGRAGEAARLLETSPDELVNIALELYLAEIEREPPVADWKTEIMQAAGLWKDRDDLPNFDEIRQSMDRDVWSR